MTNKLAQGGRFCPNEACALYGEIEAAQIIRFGKTKNGTQRYRCKECGQTFTETHGTVFYRRQATRETILETLALLAEGVRISSISRAKGIKEDTILRRIHRTPTATQTAGTSRCAAASGIGWVGRSSRSPD